MSSDDLIKQLYEPLIKDMLNNTERTSWILLRKQNPGLTDEQIKEKLKVRREELKQERQALIDKYNRLIKQNSTDTIVREILKLHNPQGTNFLECEGCDYGGYAAESPEWPCRTVDIVFSNME